MLIILYRYLYWSVNGTGGGIFQLDLTLAIAASCSNFAVGAVNIIPDYATNGINSMTLNLEDSLIYFAPGRNNLSSISLGEKLIVNYTHGSVILDARSMVSYNEYLAVPVTRTESNNGIFGLFVRIRSLEGARSTVGIFSSGAEARTNHMYMIREEFQPLPGMYVLTHVLYVHKFLSTNFEIYTNFKDFTNPMVLQYCF